jgi:antagonist of KipI
MLNVLEVGGLATIQDLGRRGWRRFGVPASGPMDTLAFRAANQLVDNALEAAAIEVGAGDLLLEARADCVIGLAGAGYDLSVQAFKFPLWDSCFVRKGWTVRLSKSGFGMWAYLAIAGGFQVNGVLGSRSTYLRGRFGGLDGRLLQPGDVLRSGPPRRPLELLSARTLPRTARPAYGPSPTVAVIRGPQVERFEPASLHSFFSQRFRLSLTSDRMGYRLEGALPVQAGSADITSEGLAMGAVQVPADGQPIVMMADCATVGGYPKIAAVVSADLPLLAQCTPGRDEVAFTEITVQAAQERYRAAIHGLQAGVIPIGSGEP